MHDMQYTENQSFPSRFSQDRRILKFGQTVFPPFLTGGPPRLLSESSHYKLNIADEILQLYIERSVLVLIETTYEILQLTLRDQC